MQLNNTLKVIGYSLLFVFIGIVFWELRNIQVDRILDKKEKQISKTIIGIVNEQAKSGILMPKVIFLNVNEPYRKKFNDSISKKISTFLIKKYIKGEKVKAEELDLAPFFVFPDSVNGNGNYQITREQLNELKAHIAFLTTQVDKAIDASKNEVSSQVSQLNRWVSIWIGVVGFLGVFIPILINYSTINDLKEIKNQAFESKTKSDNALKAAISAGKEAEIAVQNTELAIKASELANLSAETAGINAAKSVTTSLAAAQDANIALEKSKTAISNAATAQSEAQLASAKTIRLEKLFISLNDISKIKDIDASFLLYNNNPLETLKKYLIDIHTNLTNAGDIFDEEIIKDIFRQLALRLYLIAPYDFIKPKNFELLNQGSLDLSNSIVTPFTETSYQSALEILGTLTEDLSTS